METVAALVELYGEGLFRIVGQLPDEVLEALAADELVGHLLLMHDLHPVPLEERVRGAIDDVRPYVDSQGGEVELVAVDDDVVRVRLAVGTGSCGNSPVKVRLAVEDAIRKTVPDVEAVLVEGVAESHPEIVQVGLPQARTGNGAGP
jgi:Fe-S cluster biogenesis protein NfuA